MSQDAENSGCCSPESGCCGPMQVIGRREFLTVGLGQHAGPPKVFSQVPASTGLAGDWMLSMWNDLSFDRTGNLYVTDDKPRIWRVSPDGTARIWFTDPRLTGLFGFAVVEALALFGLVLAFALS